MAYANQFRDSLREAIDRRTDSMTRIILGGRGAPKKFNKAVRNKLRTKILDRASHILTRQSAKSEFRSLITNRRLRYISGRGVRQRFDSIYSWARKRVRGPIVYAFWRRKRCLYVGKGLSYRRLRAYKKNIYLKDATCVEIWQIASKAKLPSAECLAIHLFDPLDNRMKAAKVKWGKKCPVCRRHDEFKKEVDSLLRLRA
jgi:hypothetical protein